MTPDTVYFDSYYRYHYTLSECKTCKGTGEDWYPGCDCQAATCNTCNGRGLIETRVNRSETP